MFLEYGLSVEETLVEFYVNVFKTTIRGIIYIFKRNAALPIFCYIKLFQNIPVT